MKNSKFNSLFQEAYDRYTNGNGFLVGDVVKLKSGYENNENFKIKFIDCFPVSLSGIELDVEKDADTIIYGEASFKFSYFNIIRVGI